MALEIGGSDPWDGGIQGGRRVGLSWHGPICGVTRVGERNKKNG